MAEFYVGPIGSEVVRVEADNAVAALSDTLSGAGYEGYEPGGYIIATETYATRRWIAFEEGLADFVEEAYVVTEREYNDY